MTSNDLLEKKLLLIPYGRDRPYTVNQKTDYMSYKEMKEKEDKLITYPSRTPGLIAIYLRSTYPSITVSII